MTGADDGERTGTFVVTEADEGSAVLRDAASGQVHTLSTNPGFDRHEAVRATLAPDPPLAVTHSVVDVERRWTVTVEESPESPTSASREAAEASDVGDVTVRERAGTGELHVLTVPEDEERTAAAVADVLADREARVTTAARLGVARVEVRSAPGVVSVRYLP
jgi:hypothetical protein